MQICFIKFKITYQIYSINQFFLYLKVIFNKILLDFTIQLIYLKNNSIFNFLLTIFGIIVI